MHFPQREQQWEEGIVAGGGSAYIHASKQVSKLADELEGDEKTGVNIILKALEAPLFAYFSKCRTGRLCNYQ